MCEKVVSGEADRGILICGTGIGMSIAANKVPGIRRALTHDVFSAKATREHNDSNVIALGERVVGPGLLCRNRQRMADDGFQSWRAPCRPREQDQGHRGALPEE